MKQIHTKVGVGGGKKRKRKFNVRSEEERDKDRSPMHGTSQKMNTTIYWLKEEVQHNGGARLGEPTGLTG